MSFFKIASRIGGLKVWESTFGQFFERKMSKKRGFILSYRAKKVDFGHFSVQNFFSGSKEWSERKNFLPEAFINAQESGFGRNFLVF